MNFYIIRSLIIGTYEEIHLSGYKPTYKYIDLYNQQATDMEAGIPYRGNDGTVWGLKLPVGTRHVFETESFLSAYPAFKSWIDSNGTNDTDWYLHPDDKYVVRYW